MEGTDHRGKGTGEKWLRHPIVGKGLGKAVKYNHSQVDIDLDPSRRGFRSRDMEVLCLCPHPNRKNALAESCRCGAQNP
jgi:hypothetical protein